MRIAKTIGKVTLNRSLAEFEGASLRVAVPMSWSELAEGTDPQAEELVVWDDLGAGHGSLIALSEGGEAAQPFLPERKPVDAYNAAILDDVSINVKPK
jgi:ethanolamine utilization protein EutN